MGNDVKLERAKININKKNYVDKRIDDKKRVDETFGHEGCVVVNVLFSTLETEARFTKKAKHKVKCGVVGSVVLQKFEKTNEEQKRVTPDISRPEEHINCKV